MAEQGWTQIPNYLLDSMAIMHRSTFAVVLCVARKTVGWSDGNGGRKEWDRISLSQFQIVTGLSRQGVLDAIADGVARGWIDQQHDGKQSFEYRLTGKIGNPVEHEKHATSQVSRPVNSVDQSSELTSASQVSRPELVNSVDTQKKGKEIPKQSVLSNDNTYQPALLTPSNGNGNGTHEKPKRERSDKQKNLDAWVEAFAFALEGDIALRSVANMYRGWVKEFEAAGYVPEDVRVWKEQRWPLDWRFEKGQKPSRGALTAGLPEVRQRREKLEAKSRPTPPKALGVVNIDGKRMQILKHADGREELKEIVEVTA